MMRLPLISECFEQTSQLESIGRDKTRENYGPTVDFEAHTEYKILATE